MVGKNNTFYSYTCPTVCNINECEICANLTFCNLCLSGYKVDNITGLCIL
jgi:hypothetical protein